MVISNKIWISGVLKGAWKIVILILIVSAVSFLGYEYLLKGDYEVPGMIPSVLGTALAFFIGFNNNQAYDRWWEARKIWGALVNDSRTWARQILHYTLATEKINAQELGNVRSRTIRRHIAFLYALKENLRGSSEMEYQKYLSPEEFEVIASHSNKHNAILDCQSKDLGNILHHGMIDGYRFLELNKSLIAFCDEMGMSERIKNTVYPTIYYRYTGMFIWVFIISVVMVTADMIGPWSIIFGVIAGIVYFVSHKIGLALVNPFDPIITGIPLDQITRTIEINLLESLGESNIPKPVKSIDNKYVM